MLCRTIVALGAAVLVAAHAVAAEPAKKSGDADLEAQLEAAQERLDEAAREVAELSMAMSEAAVPVIRHFHRSMQRRAVLGINIGGGSDDAQGVKVISVSPGGPAARAGLQAGDLLVSIDDVALERDEDGSARAKLLRHLREVEPGQTVKLAYTRSGKRATAEVKAEAPEPLDVMIPAPPFGAGSPGAPRALIFGRAAGAFGAAELVPLTPQLGRYFGTEEGLLVVRAPRDERLKLEDGDVLLDIDGRKPTSPAHALRILGSYQSGETVKLNVLRLKKRMTLEIAVPERSEKDEPRRNVMFHRGELVSPESPTPVEPPL